MSSLQLFKYSGAGNDFIVLADGFPEAVSGYDAPALPDGPDSCRSADTIRRLCDRRTGFRAADGRIGADGLMILSRLPQAAGAPDFRMEYYNSDGSGGMMCGNGGRCITAFADFLGLKPADGKAFLFEAPDGLHTGEILAREGRRCTVRLRMIDAFGLRRVLGGWFMNTGTRHFVRFTGDVEAVDIAKEGAELRWNQEFAPEGANVNFVSRLPDGSLKIRTFEKGVEAETLACGTGITAAAIAAYAEGIAPLSRDGENVLYLLHARTDGLSVSFIPTNSVCGKDSDIAASDVYLTGPAEMIS